MEEGFAEEFEGREGGGVPSGFAEEEGAAGEFSSSNGKV